jgi:alpha-glucosidase
VTQDRVWWRDGVLYQIYPRSFADANGDGVGDLRGVIERLDHLAWLGVEGVWLTPTMPSPNQDWGYDVTDYRHVHPEFGTMDDLDELVAEAGTRDIRILLDLVPNHTSDQHKWFQDALTSPTARYRDFYVWADPKDDGSPPNNWLSVFGGEGAWELHEPTGQYYLHNFLKHQPDLNWWNDDVRNEFDDILKFWFERGIAGFRIDVAHSMIKDRELRDNLPASEDDPERIRRIGQQPIYNMNRPEGHEVIQRWRRVCDEYDPKRVLVGETFVLDVAQMVTYYGERDDELNLAFNFPFMFTDFEAKSLREVVEMTESLMPPESWPVWTGSNHDVGRMATRWCDNDDRKIRCALMLLLTMRGTPFLYYGDEIGMPEPKLTEEDLRDPVGIRFWPQNPGRDRCRTPMQWDARPGAGFTSEGLDPWLPLGDQESYNVAAQQDDPKSVLNLTRDLIAFRRDSPELTRGPYETLDSGAGVWAFRRGEGIVVVLNMSDEVAKVDGIGDVIAIATDRSRDGEKLDASVELPPWHGVLTTS